MLQWKYYIIIKKIHGVYFEIREKIQVINTFNISARYDDYKRSFDKKCTDEYTAIQLKDIKEVQKWLKEQ